MKKKDVEVGKVYVAKVSGQLTHVRLTGESPYGGWDAVNIETKRAVRIKTAARLRYDVRKRSTDDGCHHESVTTADGCGAYCRFCGETLS